MSDEFYPEGGSSFKGPSSDFIGELTSAIQENPVPAALVSVGLLWLFMGGRNVMLGGASRAVVSGAGRAAQDLGSAAYGGAREATRHVADGIGEVSERAGEAGAQVTGAVKSAADAVASAVTQTGQTITEAAASA